MQVFASGKYALGGERAGLLDSIAASPLVQWPGTSSFVFRNTQRVYGSPQLDWLLDGAPQAAGSNEPAAPGGKLGVLLQELRSAQF